MKTYKKATHFVTKIICLVWLLALGLPIAANAQPPIDLPPGCAVDFLPAYPENQIILTCMPLAQYFNGTLVVYAHGYVNPQEPLELPWEELAAFWPVVEILLENGMAFATTSCSKNGFAIEQCGDNINDLVAFVEDQTPLGPPQKVLTVGASEGAGVAAMLVEKYPDIYDGALTLCGPLGGMPYQLDYLGGFRVVFDYFFPGIIPLDGIYDLTDVSIAEWDKDIKPAILSAVNAQPDLAEQVFKVTGAAGIPGLLGPSAVNILKFSVLGTKDLVKTSGGRPFGNKWRWYRGSDDDWALNAGVERVKSTRMGRKYARKYYNTTGDLQQPLVSLHTIQDDIVAYRHELLYKFKVLLQGRSRQLISLPVIRFGHCNFEPEEVFGAFLMLVMMAN